MSDFTDAQGARRRLAWVYAKTAADVAKRLENDPDAIISEELGAANVEAWEAFCKADLQYRNLKDAFKSRIPYVERVAPDAKAFTTDQVECIEDYAKEHPGWAFPGTVLTVELANEAIDWRNRRASD